MISSAYAMQPTNVDYDIPTLKPSKPYCNCRVEVYVKQKCRQWYHFSSCIKCCL